MKFRVQPVQILSMSTSNSATMNRPAPGASNWHGRAPHRRSAQAFLLQRDGYEAMRGVGEANARYLSLRGPPPRLLRGLHGVSSLLSSVLRRLPSVAAGMRMTMEQKLDEALEETFPASDPFWLPPDDLPARHGAGGRAAPAKGDRDADGNVSDTLESE